MKKSELLKALRDEISRHGLSTFMNDEVRVVQTGCPACKKHFGTIDQLIRHLTDDVLPVNIDKLSAEKLRNRD